MTAKRSLLDRLVATVVPATIPDYAPAPVRIDDDLWCLERRARMPGGLELPTRTTIIRAKGGGLVVVSPPPVECGGLEALDALGPVEHVVVANAFHHLHARGFLQRYPAAKLWLAPGLPRRVRDLPPGTELTDSVRAPWSDRIEHRALVATAEVSEVALFHRASATLVLTDLAFNMVRFSNAFHRIGWRLSGAPVGFGHSRTARMLLLRDRTVVAAFLAKVLDWPFCRILVGHGDVVDIDARETFRRAFATYLL